jgi:hypothetical protein
MLSKLSRFLTIATLTTLTCVITHPAQAEQNADMTFSYTDEYNVEEMVNEAFWRNGGNFYDDTKPGAFFDTMFGWGSFPQGTYPENEIARDGLLIYTIMNDYFKQLQEDHPTLRTRDLENPYETSLREQPMPPVYTSPVVERTPVYQRQQYQEPVAPPSQPVRGLY